MTAAQFPTSSSSRPQRLDWVTTLLGGWMIAGIHLDAWAHHRFAETLETFFTPWHGVLYTGFLALSLWLGLNLWQGVKRGATWSLALPTGYAPALLGAALFAVGGVIDLGWHSVFGIEVNTEALLSPPHLLLGVGGGLMVAAPLRAALSRGERNAPLTALLSAAYLLSLLVFFTAFSSPLADSSLLSLRPINAESAIRAEELGVTGILLYGAMIAGMLTVILRRWRIPIGGYALLFGVAGGLTLTIHERTALIPALVGFIFALEGLAVVLRPWRDGLGFTRFVTAAPAVFTTVLLVTLWVNGSLWWGVTLCLGIVAMCAVVGWLVALIVEPSTTKPNAFTTSVIADDRLPEIK